MHTLPLKVGLLIAVLKHKETLLKVRLKLKCEAHKNQIAYMHLLICNYGMFQTSYPHLHGFNC